jgi:hypothetical protein
MSLGTNLGSKLSRCYSGFRQHQLETDITFGALTFEDTMVASSIVTLLRALCLETQLGGLLLRSSGARSCSRWTFTSAMCPCTPLPGSPRQCLYQEWPSSFIYLPSPLGLKGGWCVDKKNPVDAETGLDRDRAMFALSRTSSFDCFLNVSGGYLWTITGVKFVLRSLFATSL